MKIVAVSVLEYARQLDGRSWNPQFRWTERRAPLLLIEADNGQSGIGEAWCRQPAISLILAHLSDVIAPQLVGVEVADQESIPRIAGIARSPALASAEPWIDAAAASVIDLALWDLLARSARQPLWRMLGGRSGLTHVYASGGLYRDGDGIGELVTQMRGYVDAGFRAVKMKIGALSQVDDLARVRAVRGAFGNDVELWVDAVNQLDADSAIDWATELAAAGVAAIQAPVPFTDTTTMATINSQLLPVIAGEAEHDPARFAGLMDANAVTLLQPCLGLCGGLTPAMQLAASAEQRLIGITPQTFGTAVMQAAALHWGAATPGVHSVEYHRFHDHLASLLPPGMRQVIGGAVRLGEEPGLGMPIPLVGPQADGGDIRCVRRVLA